MPIVIWDGAVGKRKVGLFGHVAALDKELDILHPGGGPPFDNATRQRTRKIPNLRPEFSGGSSERGGVFVSQDRTVGVVIKIKQAGSPPDHHRKAASE